MGKLGKFVEKRDNRFLEIGGIVVFFQLLALLSQGADIWSNPIAGTNPNTSDPYTAGDVVTSNLSVSGVGRGDGIVGTNANNRYNANTWIVSTVPGAPVTTEFDAINGDKYFTFTLTPSVGFEIDFSSLVVTTQRSSTGPATFGLYSSVTGFTVGSNIGTVFTSTVSGSGVQQTISLGDAAFQGVSGPIEFRIYAWSATASFSGTPPNPASGTFSINDFAFSGVVLASSAAALYWDGGGNWTATAPGNGGIGTWSSGGTWVDASEANFAGAAASVAVDSVNAGGGIHFQTTGYSLTGGDIALANANIETDSDVLATISSVLGGSVGLTKLGQGTLVLNGENTFTGDIGIYSGTLSIGADLNLGDAENNIVLSGGTLLATDSMELASGRSLSGSGSLSVGNGLTLTVLGSVNSANLNFLDEGTIVLGGDVNALTGLTFSNAAKLDVSNGSELSGALTTTHTSGTAQIVGSMDLTGVTSQVFTVADGSADIDLDISANLSGVNFAKLHKVGEGTLRLSGNNASLVAGVRIGTVNVANGGRVIVTNNNSLGAGQLQFNWGVLEAENAVNFTNTVSFGSLTGKSAVFQGANMSFSSTISFFETSGQNNHITVNNTTTFSGPMVYTGSFGGIGITLAGSGTLRSTGNASGITKLTTVSGSSTLVIDGTWGGAVSVDADGTLKGGGVISGLVTISGVQAVGNSAGIQTAAGGVSYLSGSTFEWELEANDNTTPGVGGFDQLVVSGGAISIASGVTMDLVFNNAGSTVDWTDSFWDTDHTWTIVDNTGGGLLSGQFGLNASSEWFDANGVLLSAIDPDADFVLSAVNGDIVLTYYALPIPEPSTLAFLGLAGVGLLSIRRLARAAEVR